MAFFLKFTKGDPPGKKLPTPERSAEEIDDSRERYEQKRTRKFQTSSISDKTENSFALLSETKSSITSSV
jgi:hypothetical protein